MCFYREIDDISHISSQLSRNICHQTLRKSHTFSYIFFLTSIVTLLILLGSIWWKALGKHTPVSWQFGWYQVWNPKGYLSSRVSSKNENKWTKSISIAPVMVSWIHNLIFKKREHEWYVMYHIWWMQWYR